MSIKYYQLAKDEELPEEFCAVRDIGGEPSEYTFYVPETENAKLRELVRHLYTCMSNIDIDGNYECFLCEYENTNGLCDYERLMREMGVEGDA